MKKILLTLLAFLIISTPCFATHYDVMGTGDSIWYGYTPGTVDQPMITLMTYLTPTYTSHINKAVPGEPLSYTLSNIQSWLTSYTPYRVYNQAGADYGQETSELNSLLSYMTTAGATLRLVQYTPYPPSGAYIEDWNAKQEEWAYLNNIPLAPDWLELSDMTKDMYLSTSYGGITGTNCTYIHPNTAGDVVMGYLANDSNALVPTRSRDWGNALYPAMGHESLSWWLLYGTASIVGGTNDSVTGHLNGGVLTLNNGDYAVSNVVPFQANSNLVSITVTATQGTPVIKYRYKTTPFARSIGHQNCVAYNSDAYTTYTSPITLTAGTVYYFEIEIANASATQLQASLVGLNWNYTNTVINGVCGSANGQTFSSTPTTNLVSAGTASDVTLSGSTYSWSAIGSGGGSTASCSATYQAVINGLCGSSSGGFFSGAPTSNMCATGTETAFTLTGYTWSWSCAGSGGGTTDNSCTATYQPTAPAVNSGMFRG